MAREKIRAIFNLNSVLVGISRAQEKRCVCDVVDVHVPEYRVEVRVETHGVLRDR